MLYQASAAMIRILLTLSAMLWALLWAAPAAAQPLGARSNNIAVELVAESDAPAAGQAVTLAFSFTPQPGWHGYWLNPGDAGAPARVEWQLPQGVQAEPLRFPVPQTLLISGLMNYVYEGPHAVLTRLAVPAGLAPGTRLPVRVRIDYLACTDKICVPERADLALELSVGDGVVAGERRARFDGWRAALPRPLQTEGTYSVEGGRLRVALPVPAGSQVAEAYLFPAAPGVLRYTAEQSASRNGDVVIVETGCGHGRRPARIGRGAAPHGRGTGPGLHRAGGAGTARRRADRARVRSAATLLWALLGALLGGLILTSCRACSRSSASRR
jgi:DsbC/DsbD-like thiol-disulfide interchange protein